MIKVCAGGAQDTSQALPWWHGGTTFDWLNGRGALTHACPLVYLKLRRALKTLRLQGLNVLFLSFYEVMTENWNRKINQSTGI